MLTSLVVLVLLIYAFANLLEAIAELFTPQTIKDNPDQIAGEAIAPYDMVDAAERGVL